MMYVHTSMCTIYYFFLYSDMFLYYLYTKDVREDDVGTCTNAVEFHVTRRFHLLKSYGVPNLIRKKNRAR